MDDAAAVRALADRQAITDLIYRYCRAMDRIDPELGYSIWHEDGVADYGEAIYQGSGRGFIDFVCESHRRMLAHSHQITNIIIDLDGDRAGSEAYVMAALRTKAGAQLRQMSVWGRYIDRWSRRDGRWGIDKRVTIIDLHDVRDVAPVGVPDAGARDRRDPSYDVLRGYPPGGV
jgi:hypothetical protein